MDFARQQRDPTRHIIGIVFVVLVHALVIYALVTGLARKAVEVIKKPINATIIEEIKAPPPPPPPPPPRKIEPPKIQPAPQPYVPPPDIPVPTTQSEPVISSVTTTPPPEPPVIAPPPVVVAPPPPPPPKPAVRRGVTPIFRVEPVYPKEVIRAGVESGKVVARLQVDEKGNVTDVRIVDSQPPRVFDSAVIRALSQWRFQPEGDRYIAEIEVNFSLTN
jgi:periplasmic protein TonB